MSQNVPFYNKLELFIIDTSKKFESQNLSNEILNLRHMLVNPKQSMLVKKKTQNGLHSDKILFFNKPYKGYIHLIPKFTIEIKNDNGIYTFELEKKQRRGYKVIIEKKIKVNILKGAMQYAGFIKNIEKEVVLEKEYNTFVDDFSNKIYG